MDFVFGLQKNERLIAMIEGELAQAEGEEPAHRGAGATLQELHVDDARELESQPPCRGQGRVDQG